MFSCVSLNELFISYLKASIIFSRWDFRLESSSSGALGYPGLAVEAELCLMVFMFLYLTFNIWLPLVLSGLGV